MLSLIQWICWEMLGISSHGVHSRLLQPGSEASLCKNIPRLLITSAQLFKPQVRQVLLLLSKLLTEMWVNDSEEFC